MNNNGEIDALVEVWIICYEGSKDSTESYVSSFDFLSIEKRLLNGSQWI